MSAQPSPKNATNGQQASKPLTPAQTAKPYGTAAKNAASPVSKKAESHPTEQAADIANDDTVKAIEKLETRIKAVYVILFFLNKTSLMPLLPAMPTASLV